MATPTGYDWGDWTYFQISGTDCDGSSGAATDDWDNNESNTCDAISLDLYAACEISLEVQMAGSGTPSADGVNVKILRDVDGTNYEASTDDPWGFTWTGLSALSTTYRKVFNPRGKDGMPGPLSKFKLWVENKTDINDCKIILRYRRAQVPAAATPSGSPSASESASISASVSASPSASVSASPSASVSASPSASVSSSPSAT